MKTACLCALFLGILVGVSSPVAAQTPSASTQSKAAAPAPPTVPADYLIGPGDVLNIVFWRDKDMSVEAVVVRPDGKISMPLLNEVDAAGRSPEQLRAALTTAASKLIQEPNVTVVVKEINSRLVYITGSVAKSGPYAIQGALTVLQLIAMAGGLAEYADSKNITIMRMENGKSMSFKFNYKEVVSGKRVQQNILLRPNDTVVVLP